MPGVDKFHKNTLTIRLSESAVFLRSTNVTGRRHYLNDSATTALRGLLILDLVKPTRISSIELDLQAKACTSWPEGIGARRIEVTEEHKPFHASTVFFRAGPAPRRTASVGPGVSVFQEEDWDHELHSLDTPRNANERTRDSHLPSLRVARRVSANISMFHATAVSHQEHIPIANIPPYSPTAPTSSTTTEGQSSPRTPLSGQATAADPAQHLEGFRNALRSGLVTDHSSPTSSQFNISNGATGSSASSFRSLSRRPSIEDVLEDVPGPSHAMPRRPATVLAPIPLSMSPSQFREESRGRRHSRFSLATVSNAIMGAVHSRSPRTSVDRNKTVSRERLGNRSVDRDSGLSRGRTRETRPGAHAGSPAPQKERSAFMKFGDILKLDIDEKDSHDEWKEFKKGTYTYPISFTIPGNSPPTLDCDYGSVRWRLKATVHRPGTFKSKMTTSKDVIVISCPGEEDTEDTDNIIVERHWDSQLQYLISISGRSFYIGGTVPIRLTMMPLAKIKIYRISVYIEERVDYYTYMKRIARTDPITRIQLLSLKTDNKNGGHILPLESDDVDAFRNSPMFAVVTPDDDPSDMASKFMGPGPWSFQQDLKLPSSCSVLRFTNKNWRSNITITHILKVVIRVERGDNLHIDPKTGKRKLFDIVVQTPVQILSCRCNPEWTSLPRYTESFEGSSVTARACPCEIERATNAEQHRAALRAQVLPATLERMTSQHSSDSSASTASTSPVIPSIMPSLRRLDSLFDQNAQFERLVAGQESEVGEAPPAYDSDARSPHVR